MAADTKIEWATHTFNPWIGCGVGSSGITPKDQPAAAGDFPSCATLPAARLHPLLCRPCRRSEKCQH